AGFKRRAGNVDREKLAGDAARLKAVEIRVKRVAVGVKLAEGIADQIEIFIDHRRRDIVVTVNNDGFFMDFERLRPELRVGACRHRLGKSRNAENKHKQKRDRFFHMFWNGFELRFSLAFFGWFGETKK